MQINRIKLWNFRNYKEAEVSFDPGINIFLGDNAQGKTNLLEAIFFLGGGKSYRTTYDREILRWGEDVFALSGDLWVSDRDYQVKVMYRREGKKRVKENGLEGSKLKGNFKVVIFSPEDLDLVKGSPSLRRDFLDRELTQIQASYGHALQNYNRILRQRNKLLKVKGVSLEENLAAWDQQLVEEGSRVIIKRVESVSRLNILARLIHRRLTGGGENLSLSYLSTLGSHGNKDIAGISLEEAKIIFRRQLKQKKREEMVLGNTLCGPHRDDLLLSIDGRAAKSFASQGQQRTGILALKLAVLELVKAGCGEYPVLLLDDVFSELDFKRRDFLIQEIKDNIQTFITSAREDVFTRELSYPARFFLIKEGECGLYNYGKNK